ncbi:MAG TPA: NADH-quinone oxidoreductase subunit J [Thermoanaerobaculia bacterium]|nr:NADH-quinone oxidoreductase subunit J [Thermoanaerobaculia bacterium]
METLVFAVFAFLAVASAIAVVAHRNPVYSTMSLVVTLFSVAVLFVMLGAPFLGVIQVLVYAGAIVVLFLFVIMLLNIQAEEMPQGGQMAQRIASILGAVVFAGMLGLVFWRTMQPNSPPLTEELVSLRNLSRELFFEYLLAFEMIGLLLLVAVIGATVVARRPQQADTTEDWAASGDAPRVDGARSEPHINPETGDRVAARAGRS